MRAVRALAILLLVAAAAYLYFAFLHPRHPIQDHPFFDGRKTSLNAVGPHPHGSRFRLRPSGSGGPAEAPRRRAARPALGLTTLVIAHQGGRGLWPENTLLAFERSLELGVDVLEMDLRPTSDGPLVVLHDASVDRTTDGQGLVVGRTLDEVRKLDAGYRFPGENGDFPYRGKGLVIPTLEEVLSRFPEARLNLEMKDLGPDRARSLCGALREGGALRRVLVASFDHESMAAFRDSCPEVATSATMREGFLFYQLNRLGLGSVFRSSAVAFQVPEYFGELHVIQPPFLELARSFNVRVQVWTVNEEEDLARMLAMGVDGIVTDYPDRLLRLMGRLAAVPPRR